MNRFLVTILAFALLISFVSTWFAALPRRSEDPSPVAATQSENPQGGAFTGPDGEAIFRLPDGTAIRARREDVIFDERGRPAQIASRVHVTAEG